VDTLWPDFDRRELWRLCEEYAHRERRFGTAPPNEPESEPQPQLVPGVE
jgi:undecaprenyl diphosphate synthase